MGQRGGPSACTCGISCRLSRMLGAAPQPTLDAEPGKSGCGGGQDEQAELVQPDDATQHGH
eukprot:923606-Alexandrium_andersonii.AAC.1